MASNNPEIEVLILMMASNQVLLNPIRGHFYVSWGPSFRVAHSAVPILLTIIFHHAYHIIINPALLTPLHFQPPRAPAPSPPLFELARSLSLKTLRTNSCLLYSGIKYRNILEFCELVSFFSLYTFTSTCVLLTNEIENELLALFFALSFSQYHPQCSGARGERGFRIGEKEV